VRDGDLGLGQVGLDAQTLDHRVQLGRLLRRDLPRAHGPQRDLVRREELEGQQPGGDDAIVTPLAPEANRTPMSTA
jgi:hypothetical protein